MIATSSAYLARPTCRFRSNSQGGLGGWQHSVTHPHKPSISCDVKKDGQTHRPGKPDSKNDQRDHYCIARFCAFTRVTNRGNPDQYDGYTENRVKDAQEGANNSRLVGLKNVSAVDAIHCGTRNLAIAIATYKKGQISLQKITLWLFFICLTGFRNITIFDDAAGELFGGAA
ncbi:hypothetical protein [Rhizobium nepotum]|uniref:hypothetical protein n=1 Tax=Rhizobium nepotum TaxID=1035271 RepID=UPI000A7F0AEA|nr:hypothetical protein [Rhizobium nepotum]